MVKLENQGLQDGRSSELNMPDRNTGVLKKKKFFFKSLLGLA